MIVAQVRFADAVTIPMSFDVKLNFDDQDLIIGGTYVIPFAKGQMYGGTEFVSNGHRNVHFFLKREDSRKSRQ